MWPCRRGVRRRATVWAHLVTLSVIVHGIVLFLLFFVYRGYYGEYDSYVVALGKKAATSVVFLPLYKRVGSQVMTTAKTSSKSKVAKIPQHVATKTAKRGTSLESKQVKKRAPSSKPTPAPVTKKTSQQKTAEKKKQEVVQPAVRESKQVASKRPKEETHVKQPEKIIEPTKMTEKLEQEVSLPQVEPIEIAHNEVVPIHDENISPIYIGQAERDALLMHEQIQSAIEHYWHPPSGLSHDLVCDMRVVVGWDGKSKHITVEKASGVPVYDISARSALTKMTFPSCAFGKEIVIHFAT